MQEGNWNNQGYGNIEANENMKSIVVNGKWTISWEGTRNSLVTERLTALQLHGMRDISSGFSLVHFGKDLIYSFGGAVPVIRYLKA